MYRIGQEEIDRVAGVIKSKKMFRYMGEDEGECNLFEKRYAGKLDVKHCVMTASGTNSLTAALIGAGIGPGDEVIVPACTYMATPISVLAVGAIPVIIDVDESIGMSPEALKELIGPRTRAAIPVHMWGLACDMNSIMDIAREKNLIIIEDACQGVGGAYEGRMLGSIGHIGAFSFNYFKNMSCGEGGAVVTSSDDIAERINCAVDPCKFYWDGRKESFAGFVVNGARASEIEGAMMNCQLDKIDDIINTNRAQKKRILKETTSPGLGAGSLVASPNNSPDWECGTHVTYILPTTEAADVFAERIKGTVAVKTGRHVYTEWDPILEHRGAHHEALNPFNLAQNKGCRMEYSLDMCSKSLDILGRTVFIGTNPDRTDEEVDEIVGRINEAAASLLTGSAV